MFSSFRERVEVWLKNLTSFKALKVPEIARGAVTKLEQLRRDDCEKYE